MKRLQIILILAVLLGIIIELGKVFIFLFDKLDEGNMYTVIPGATFAIASVLFVVEIKSRTVKIIMITLDVATILYYYLFYKLLAFPIEYVSIVIAFYSGMIIYYFGKILSTSIDSEQASNRQREEGHRQRIDSERLSIESEIRKCRQRIRQSRTDETRRMHEARLAELEKQLDINLKN